MNLKKYSVTCTVTKEVVVTIDLDKINEEFMEEFSKYFWEVDEVEEVVKYIARCKALDFDPEGVGCQKKWSETEEEALQKNGFIAEVDYEEDEQEIN